MNILSISRRSLLVLMGICYVWSSAVLVPDVCAQVVLSSPDLPPESDPPAGDPRCDQVVSLYAGIGVHAVWPGPIDMSDPIHKCFRNVTRQNLAGDELEDFDSILDAKVDLGSGPVPIQLTGPVTTVVFGKTGNTTGTFSTEIVALSLTGNVGGIPIEIRESPSQQSSGQTTITDLGGGLWQIDSFFDVFTELSVNGGPFQPQIGGPSRMTLAEASTVSIQEEIWGTVKSLFR